MRAVGAQHVSDDKSYRQILRSSSIIGGASVVGILVGLVRTKVVAVLLGPSGVGLIGLFNNLIGTAANVASLGFGPVGTRQIAEASAQGDAISIAATRRALFWGTLVLAFSGALIFWLMRDFLAVKALNDKSMADDVGWLALGVALTVAAISQSSLLNGLRRISDLAWVAVLSAILASAVGIPVLLVWGSEGVLAYLLLVPSATFFVGWAYAARVPKVHADPTPLSVLFRQWRSMARLGMAFMLGGLAVTASNLAVRTLVQRELGVSALGHFEASWLISMTYVGLVLRAMGTDFFPRLTAVINDPLAANKLVNQQTEVVLLLAGPMVLALIGLTPWVVKTMYSTEFMASVEILRWQILGDILKFASWPLGVVIIAAGDGKTYLFAEVMAVVVLVVAVWIGLPHLGLSITGIGFMLMYGLYLPFVYWLAKKRTGFRWTTSVGRTFLMLLALAILAAILASSSAFVGASFAVSAGALYSLFAVKRLSIMADLSGPLASLKRLSMPKLRK